MCDTLAIWELIDTPYKVEQQPVFKTRVRNRSQEFELVGTSDRRASGRLTLRILRPLGVKDDPNLVKRVFTPALRVLIPEVSGVNRGLNNIVRIGTYMIGNYDDTL